MLQLSGLIELSVILAHIGFLLTIGSVPLVFLDVQGIALQEATHKEVVSVHQCCMHFCCGHCGVGDAQSLPLHCERDLVAQVVPH